MTRARKDTDTPHIPCGVCGSISVFYDTILYDDYKVDYYHCTHCSRLTKKEAPL